MQLYCINMYITINTQKLNEDYIMSYYYYTYIGLITVIIIKIFMQSIKPNNEWHYYYYIIHTNYDIIINNPLYYHVGNVAGDVIERRRSMKLCLSYAELALTAYISN